MFCRKKQVKIDTTYKAHEKACTDETYKGKHPNRFKFDQALIPWTAEFPDYKPVEYTAKVVFDNERCAARPDGWADPRDFLSMEDLYLKRKSFCGDITKMRFPNRGLPRNPMGRTGMSGRGLLGKWGPNQAADPIVTCRSPVTKLLHMVAIRRSDTHTWAIPGGMVDDGERVTKTLKREFGEEAAEKSVDMERVLNEIFHENNAVLIFQGYVDDPRNTDNSWMETTVVHYHCAPHLAERLGLSAGDDAERAAWICIEDDNERFRNLYASHRDFVVAAVKKFHEREAAKQRKKK
eukprot:c6579_g1_i1.p1 GENE.c6579_g1_i1~~c6579_g1_i1.p1  ORF type:complete len:293 (+),score=49.03 c6579_g1_i1:34-912(+)